MESAKKSYELGLHAQNQGNTRDALKHYKQAVTADPNFRPAWNNLGTMYAKLGRPDLALGFYRKALAIKEDDVIYFNIASEHFRLDQVKDCEISLKRALKLNPRMLRAHLLLAYLFGKSGDKEKAEICFRNAVILDPLNRSAVLGLIVIYSEKEKFEEAIKLIDHFTSKKQDDAMLSMKAGILMKSGRHDESLIEYNKLSQSSEKFTRFTDHLEKIRQEHAREAEALASSIKGKIRERSRKIKAMIENKKSGGIAKELFDMSLLHLFHGDREKALTYLMRAKKAASGTGE